MIKYMPKSVTDLSWKVTEMVTEIQTFNRDGVAYGVGECKVY